jgi:CRISPR-associated protein Cmr5
MQTRDQRYAETIFNQVSALPESEHQKYGAMAHKLPILVRTAGLVQALAFVEARGDATQQQLLDHIAAVVLSTQVDGQPAPNGANGRGALLEKSRTASLDEYMHLSRQVMTALLWYKRFAQSVLEVEQGTEPEGSN